MAEQKEAAQKESGASGSAPKKAGGSSPEVMLPEFQPGASSAPPQNQEEMAKKAEEIAKAEEQEMQEAQADKQEALYGHMKRGTDR